MAGRNSETLTETLKKHEAAVIGCFLISGHNAPIEKRKRGSKMMDVIAVMMVIGYLLYKAPNFIKEQWQMMKANDFDKTVEGEILKKWHDTREREDKNLSCYDIWDSYGDVIPNKLRKYRKSINERLAFERNMQLRLKQLLSSGLTVKQYQMYKAFSDNRILNLQAQLRNI